MKLKFENMRFLLYLLPFCVNAQNSDILLLQKHHKTVSTWLRGYTFNFYTTDHSFVSAVIDSVKNDSLYLAQYQVNTHTNLMGMVTTDTVKKYILLFSLADIGSVPANRRRSNVLGNGTIFLVAGGAYLALNVINTIADGDPVFGEDNLSHLALGASLLGIGIIQRLIHHRTDEYRIGKKYRFKILPVEVQPR